MPQDNSTDKLVKFIIIALVLTVIYLVCRSIGPVLAYILAAAVVSLIGRPVSLFLERIRIKDWHMPQWMNAALTIILVLSVLTGVVMLVVPVFSRIASDLSNADMGNSQFSLAGPLASINEYLQETFPFLGPDFNLQDILIEQLGALFDVSKFTSVISSVASFIASVGVAIFSTVFISFFFLKDRKLFPDMIAAIVPDRLEAKTRESISEIEGLISRYASGLCLEVLGITAINFLGLLLIGRLGFEYAIGIAFMTGILNVIPYVGPLIGELAGATIAVTAKYVCTAVIGLNVAPPAYFIIIFAILFGTQLVDNFFFQPFIYSNCVKAHPLEIFIILLLAGYFKGMLGMFVAIPLYTVLRVIAAKFFGHLKPVRKLIGEP